MQHGDSGVAASRGELRRLGIFPPCLAAQEDKAMGRDLDGLSGRGGGSQLSVSDRGRERAWCGRENFDWRGGDSLSVADGALSTFWSRQSGFTCQ